MSNIPAIMQEALYEATCSPDPSTQNGAVIIAGNMTTVRDYNHFPYGVAMNAARWERPLKYKYVEHAERNAIYRAARLGIATAGATMVCPWAACSDCARAIAAAGICTLVRIPENNADTHARWHEDCLVGDTIMQEAGVEIVEFTDLDALMVPDLRRNGKPWKPQI